MRPEIGSLDMTAWKDVEAENWQVRRDGDLDLAFSGWRVGSGGNSGLRKDWTRGTTVGVYLTAGGQLVTAVRQWTRWKGERASNRAAVHKTPAAALDWLRDDAGGQLGRASKEAWVAACAACPMLEGRDVEAVE